jgi:putative transposase
MKTFYRRNLPHIQPVGAAFFITFRLAGSIPKASINGLIEKYHHQIQRARNISNLHLRNLEIFNLRKIYLVEMDLILDKINEGPHYLKDIALMNIIGNEFKNHDGVLYDLIAYCIMSNHIHLVIDTGNQLADIKDDIELNQKYVPLDKIMKQIKGATAQYCNKYLNRSGQFWERESFDIYIRSEKMLNNVISYTLNNPVKAVIVDNWEDFPGNYFVEKAK